ncbi:unnamed protein product [Scytosiphon promiscuus]
MRLAARVVLGLLGTAWRSLRTNAATDLTDLPIIAIWSHPSTSSLPECGGDCDMVRAAYVKWVASAGARSLPIRYDATPEELGPILDGVNGLLFPGGTPPPTDGARWALDYAKGLNDGGDFFPVWGTCLGWEWMAELLAADYPVITPDFDAENFTQPLGLVPGAADSRMLSGIASGLLEKATIEPLTTNAHHKGVAPDDFAKSGLDRIFRVLAINTDRQGLRQYVSTVEGIKYPWYGLQWHPEKSQFDWGLDPDGTPHHVINHTKDAVELSQVLAVFFVSETRRNGHSFPSIMEWEPKMFHTRKVTPAGPRVGQMYYLHLSDAGRNSSATTGNTTPLPQGQLEARRRRGRREARRKTEIGAPVSLSLHAEPLILRR